MRFSALRQALATPGYSRMLVLRRGLAVVLVCAALISVVMGTREQPRVLAFARDVEAGSALDAGDVATIRLPAESVPDSALQVAPEELEGRIVVAAAGAGEVLTEQRVLGAELTQELVGDVTSHLLPLKLAEPQIITHLHHGDTVNIVTVDDAAEPEVVAAGARIVSTGAVAEGNDATVLVALAESQAHEVAAASLQQPLTVVIVGDRAGD